ncbi:MAG: hypothetical protein JXC32_21670 [Anaerolineae bacterium]|nr:hypothetical protein [Anaerolineae bacterium]
MPIGKLIKSNSHTDYVCQIYGPAEVATPPAPQDYAFGTFVQVPLDGDNGYIVGVIYDTILVNPDFGNLGPRLSPAPDLAVFSPDYLAEKVTLAGITALGSVAADGTVRQGVPRLAAQIDTLVDPMTEEAIRAFHATAGGVAVTYAPTLLAQARPLTHHLLMSILGHLHALFPASAAQLDVLTQELSWRAYISPLGGVR